MNTKNIARSSSSTSPGEEREPIAIIGIGCRLPGANGPEEFWRLLRDGVDAITEIPSDRFDVDSVYDPEPGAPGKIINRAGGFLKDIDGFDASFFGISPREALRLDPQQRLLLEVTWEALEDAGVVPRRLAGSKTGVFVGACTVDYEDIQYHLRDRSEIDLYVATGTARSVLSGRVSYFFDLLGPSLTVDTACSSSLVAVHLACQSLRNGECTLAIAGGVNLVLLPELSMPFSRARMLAADSRCRFGDASAAGFTRSDGVGVVLLKPLAKALADQDRIYALILGTAVNNDGRSSGLLATPSREGQKAVLREAYRDAGISPGLVQYVEVHGTGTGVGDPVEVESLGAVLAEGRRPDSPCIIGSVKTNIGHTEGAAGIAGLIKAALCLDRKAIPPSLHFKEPNPSIPWHDLPLQVAKELTSWPESPGPALAGVSAFGLSATNAHVVLQGAPKPCTHGADDSDQDSGAHLLTLSAHTKRALEDMAKSFMAFNKDMRARLADLCYSASVRRTHHDHRLAITARSREELGDSLQAFLKSELRPGLAQGESSPASERKLVFVFPGQGSQWPGMGRQLMNQEPVFRDALASCEDAFRRHVAWSLIEELSADPSRSRLDEIDVVQPCLFAIQVALARLWQHWGIVPDAVVGQSMGEIAAAHVAGALSLDDAAQVICLRSLLLKRLSGRGGMAVIGLSFEETERAVAGYEDRLSIAVSSSPTSTVIAGETDALHEVIEALKSDGVFCQPVKVDVASHSPQMDALREDLLGALVGINPRPPSVRVYSTVTGDAANDPAFDAEYWAANLRKPVLFSGAIKDLLESGYEIFLELSPHPVLSGPIQQTLQHSGREARVLPSLRHDEDERTVMLGSLGALYTAGCSIQWDRLYSKNRQLVQLPPFAWQRERYWLGPEEKPNNRPGRVNAPRHLLSGPCLRPATDAGAHYWEFDLSIEAFPFLKDHCIQGTAVLPAAAYLEMAITAGRSVFPDGDLILEQVQFKKPLILSEGLQRVQLVISSQEAGNATFEFFSREKGQQEDSWSLNAMGTMRAARHEPAAMRLWIQTIKSRCRDDISQAQHYESLAKRGLQYGPCFRGVEKLGRGNGEAIAEIALPQTLAQEAGIYCFHPALLDSCFQVLAATLSDLHTHTYLPVGLKGLRIHNPPGQDVMSYATLLHRTRRDSEVLTGDILVLDQRGQVILEARALTMKRMGEEVQEKQRVERLLYGLEWVSSNRPQLYGSGRHTSAWMVFTDGGGVGERLVEILESNGESCVTVSAGESYAELGPGRYQINAASFHDYVRLLSEALSSQGRPFSGVVHLWSLNSPEASVLTSDSLEDSHTSGVCSAHLLAKALAGARQSDSPRLWLVTRAAQSVTGDECLSIAQSPLWGLGKVISQEHPNLRCSLVDLGAASDQETLSLSLELSQDGREDQVALRGEERYVARLVRLSAPDPALSKKEALAEDQPFCLDITMPGILDSLTLRETARRNPGPGEIEIQVHALGLNFRDIMLAMGVLPSAPEVKEDFGWECAGKVVGVGDGVEEFKVGDDVLAIAHPCLRAYVTTPACLALHKPASLSYEQAATIPLAWLTAHYSLNRLGRLRSGERVLIHAASGGVGLAAVRIAQHLQAEIFATAGSDEKRRFLKTLGIRHVFDSRSLNFVDEIMKVTNGDGVDVVLNSLAGEAIPAGLSVLRAGGRFLELGRQDIYKNSKLGLSPFQNNLAFFAIDLAHLIRQNPPHMGSLLREAIDLFEKSSGSPLPLQSFSIADVAESFRLMARAGQVGKVALRVHGERVSVATSAQEGFALCPNATYLITGGLGGLGLSVARWMIEQGARHLVLIGRTDGPRSAQEAVDTMRRTAEVMVLKADVSSYQQISGVMDRLGQSMPPLKGVVHAAGLLDDGMLLQLDRSRFDSVMAPKVAGAWNLHLLTLNAPLDFFVLFSSAAALLGSPGQGNYSAANAFLDCLAHYRRSNGLPALSINWGPWSEVGLAAEGERGERLARRGISSISPSEGAKLFAHLLKSCASPQAAAMDFDFRQWSQCYPTAAASPLFTEIASRSDINRPDARAKESGLTRDALLAADQAERGELLKSYMNAVAARVLGFAKSGPHKLDANQPMNRLGMDSLMALEMKTRIEADLGIKIPVVDFLKGTSIAQLAKSATDQLSMSSAVINTCVAKAAARQWEELII